MASGPVRTVSRSHNPPLARIRENQDVFFVFRAIFQAFERRVDPFPAEEIAPPRPGLWRFVWDSSAGMRGHILVMALCTALIGAFEAWMFGALGTVVDTLGQADPAGLWPTHRADLLLLLAIVLGSVALVALQTMLKHQTLAGSFPMRLRWNFHRLMLGQSLAFYQDEFAGRVAAKVMQTALAVRDTTFILTDILVFVTIYFVTMTLLAGGLGRWLLLPFVVWLLLYAASVAWFVPRLARVGRTQADARSLMTGRVSDAYTNIATVKLFSHARREADFARSAMGDFLVTVHGQMRLVSLFEIVNHLLSMGLIAATAGMTLWLWSQGQVGIGAVAAATAMALRLNGMSHWVMWEMTGLFEHIGTVQDGLATLSQPRRVVDRPGAATLAVPRGEIRLERLTFGYGGATDEPLIRDLDLHIRPGERVGLVGRSGAGKSTLTHLLLRFHDLQGGRILIDGQDIATVTQDSLRAQIGMVAGHLAAAPLGARQHPVRPPGRGRRRDDRGRVPRRGRRLHPPALRPVRAQRLRRAGRRARRQALGRAAPAHRHRAGDPEGRADPAARRGHQRARLRGRGGDPGQPGHADAGQDGGGDRAPALDHRGDGPAGRARPRPHRRAGRPRHAAGARWALRPTLGAAEWRFSG